MNIVPHMPKGARHTIGARIENTFLDLLELSYLTYFTPREQKPPKIAECIFILDKLKFLMSVAWDGRLISNRHCEEIATKMDEMGKMFGGWKGRIDSDLAKERAKQNPRRPA